VIDSAVLLYLHAAPVTREAMFRLTTRLRADSEVAAVRPLIEPARRYEELVVVGRHEYGRQTAQRFVARLRETIVPHARFPRGTRVLAGGGAAQGVDFLRRSDQAFPWLVLAVLRAYLPAAHARIPVASAAAQGGAPQPPLGFGELRHARRRLPLGGARPLELVAARTRRTTRARRLLAARA
jgi:hypothetical protein